jgi:hypothetical protein
MPSASEVDELCLCLVKLNGTGSTLCERFVGTVSSYLTQMLFIVEIRRKREGSCHLLLFCSRTVHALQRQGEGPLPRQGGGKKVGDRREGSD